MVLRPKPIYFYWEVNLYKQDKNILFHLEKSEMIS